jgi:hypothetical protein
MCNGVSDWGRGHIVSLLEPEAQYVEVGATDQGSESLTACRRAQKDSLGP